MTTVLLLQNIALFDPIRLGSKPFFPFNWLWNQAVLDEPLRELEKVSDKKESCFFHKKLIPFFYNLTAKHNLLLKIYNNMSYSRNLN